MTTNQVQGALTGEDIQATSKLIGNLLDDAYHNASKVVSIQDDLNKKRGDPLVSASEKKELTFEIMTGNFNQAIHPGSKHEPFLQAQRQIMSGLITNKASLKSCDVFDATVLNTSKITHRTHNNRLSGVDNSATTKSICPGMESRIIPLD